MNRRLIWAFCAYAALAIGAAFTLEGKFLYFVWMVLAYFAARTYVAHKARW